MNTQSTTINDIKVKKTIAIEVARKQSFLIGCFQKPRVPEIVINQWATASVSNPKFLNFIAEEIVKILKKIDDIDLICGIETAGIGIAAASSITSGIPWIYARKEKKSYGSMEAFEGTYYKGARIIFIDNMCASGKGMPEIIKNAEKEGFIFHHQIVILDNDWIKSEEYKKYGITVHSLITTKELINELNLLHYFPNNLYHFMDAYLNNPQEWKPGSRIVKDFINELNKSPDLPYLLKRSCKFKL